MRLGEFDYELPKELIAQVPVEPRDSSRLMVVSRNTGKIEHDYFYNLPNYLNSSDLMVFNESKVFPARLFGNKKTGGKVEVLLLSRVDNTSWKFIGKNLRGVREVGFEGNLTANIVRPGVIKFDCEDTEMMPLLNRIGYTPLPPYIITNRLSHNANIRRRYQTVYARDMGSAAAPTAGLHFTKKLIKKLRDLEIQQEFVTLHVGLGTFLPVKAENIEEHKMHSEFFRIDQETRNKIQTAKRVVAVGTTSVRVLESDWSKNETDIFIYPGYKFKNVGAMITNFHLPKSSLLMLVSAFAGKELIFEAYRKAIEEKYRFFSFGDAMIIL